MKFRRSGGHRGLAVAAAAAVAAAFSPAAAAADLTFPVRNAAADGMYWHAGPDWHTAEAVRGFGVFDGATIAIRCYQMGAANVPGTADQMWDQATAVAGRAYGGGWINQYFVADGQAVGHAPPGLPRCDKSPPPSTAAPAATSSSSPGGQGLVFAVFNAGRGMDFRKSPHWADTQRSGGTDIHDGDRLQLICGAYGDGVGPFDNTAWSYVTTRRANAGSGWVNEHFIADGAAGSSFSANEPVCGSEIPGAAHARTSPPGDVHRPGGSGAAGVTASSSLVGGGSLYYSPDSHNQDQSPATVIKPHTEWHPTAAGVCPDPQDAVPAKGGVAGGKLITTLAAWGGARTGPVLFLLAKPPWMDQVHYILLFDPGTRRDYENGACPRKYGREMSLALATWLAHDPANSVVVLAGETTADYADPDPQGLAHAGLQDVLFPAIKAYPRIHGRNIRKQVVVCNYDQMNHQDIWGELKGYMNSPPITISTCPPTPGYFPARPTFGWSP